MIARTDAAGTSVWNYGNDASKHNVNKLVQINGVANVSPEQHGEIKISKPTSEQIIQANHENVKSAYPGHMPGKRFFYGTAGY